MKMADWTRYLLLFGFGCVAGTVLGGQLGVRLTVAKGHAWVKAMVTILIVLFALRLLL
jgi:uncharacterized membrane protein YfcA